MEKYSFITKSTPMTADSVVCTNNACCGISLTVSVGDVPDDVMIVGTEGRPAGRSKTWRIKRKTLFSPARALCAVYWNAKMGMWHNGCYTLYNDEQRKTTHVPEDGEWEIACEFPRTVIEFTVPASSLGVLVEVYHILTDEQKDELCAYWKELWDVLYSCAPTTVSVLDERIIEKVLRHFGYNYSILVTDLSM